MAEQTEAEVLQQRINEAINGARIIESNLVNAEHVPTRVQLEYKIDLARRLLRALIADLEGVDSGTASDEGRAR